MKPALDQLSRSMDAISSTEWFRRASTPAATRPALAPPIRLSDSTVTPLRELLRATYFAATDRAFLDSESGRAAVDVQAVWRYNDCINMIGPWAMRARNLAGTHLAEIGCGTGSSTAAFARVCASVRGYDIDEISITASRGRFEILGVRNAEVVMVPPQDLLKRMSADHLNGVDAILCYAVLEHQHLHERLETLRECWRMLRPGGIFIIADTPNRLTYNDTHTSLMPFFNQTWHEVAIAYADRSPRTDFAAAIMQARGRSDDDAKELLTRWGRGVSYHDFELALGPKVHEWIVGDGFDPEILAVKPVEMEELLVALYAAHAGVKVHPGFFRRSIDVILRKPS
jgi:S-adenosylmethionine-dependent methyltransferase